MRGKVLTLMAPIAAIAVLAVGGVAYAANGTTANQPSKAKVTANSEAQSAPDTDTIQSGDQTTPDTASNAKEGPESANESGSEVPGDDGPGGHADEPGSPNADHQFEGKE
jgi:hypothetical protein